MVAQGFTVDLNKPLVFQVGHLGYSYEEWLHQPIITRESPRFFANGLLEFLTRTPWWAIPSVSVPVVGWLISTSSKRGLLPPHIAATLVAGNFTWTFRVLITSFCFPHEAYWILGKHTSLSSSWLSPQAPNGWTKACLPPAATAILLLPLWSLVKLLVPFTYAPAFLGGGLLGYIIYDCTHYYLHHGKPLKGVSHSLKRYHMDHHFKVQDKGYGITSDFGTLPPKPSKKIG